MNKATRYLAAAVVFLLPIYYYRFSVAKLPTNAIEVAVAVLGLLTLVNLIIEKRRPTFPFFLPIFLLVMALALGSWGAPDRQAAFGIVKGWFIVPVIFYWSVLQNFDRQSYRLLVSSLIYGALAVGAYALLQYLGLIGLTGYQASGGAAQYVDQGRALAFYESPNYLAMFLAPTTALLIWLTVYHKGWRRWLGLVVSLGLVLIIVVSSSRSGLVALAWSSLLLMAATARTVTRRLWLAAGLLLVTGLVLWLFPHAGGLDNQRFYLWSEALSYYRMHPLWGIGPGAYQHYFQLFGNSSPAVYRLVLPYALHPHNLYLNLLLSGGPVALIAFVWIVLGLFWQSRRAISNSMVGALIVAILVILTQGLFDTTYFKNDLSIVFWLLVAGIVINCGPQDTHDDKLV